MTKLFCEAEKAGVTVEYLRLPLNESMSISDSGGNCVLMDYSLINAGAGERVHLAHELGHCITGSFYNPYSRFDVREKHESQADRWAIKKLVPMDELKDAVKRGYIYKCELAEYFDVTEDFIGKAIEYYTQIARAGA